MQQDFKLIIKLKDIIHICVVFVLLSLVGGLGYWLGTLHQKASSNTKKQVFSTNTSDVFSNYNSANNTIESPKTAPGQAKIGQTALSSDQSSDSKDSSTGTFVASKNGTKYYTKDCAGANRIKAENIVTFTTKTEAEDAGYEEATNC